MGVCFLRLLRGERSKSGNLGLEFGERKEFENRARVPKTARGM